MIPVTKTFFPPLDEYTAQVKRAYDNHWLTNRGELVKELEAKIKEYLQVSNVLITNNGTVPLQIALKLLGKNAEIITTPFSYVATTAAILWENCTPVFVDIHPEYLCIDESKIEAAITPRTTCILATHVFGNPCAIDAIEQIALKHNLHVIYDAAHCFGVKYLSKSIFSYGDISTCSFHATKLFHTGEGGAVFCENEDLRTRVFYSHNFGHIGPVDFFSLGINAKISELQAAMGLAVLPYMDYILSERKAVVDFYNSNLKFDHISSLKLREHTQWNYAYYPVVFESQDLLLNSLKKLNDAGVTPRRYFYPSLNRINFVNGPSMPISESIASRVLCLPLYAGMPKTEMQLITDIVNSSTQ